MPKITKGYLLDDRQLSSNPTPQELEEYKKWLMQSCDSVLAETPTELDKSKSATIPEKGNKN
jgi:hypothetical protein